jgi:hypothetical protein
VSHRTVAFHLRNIFTKAGVTSRGELAQFDLSEAPHRRSPYALYASRHSLWFLGQSPIWSAGMPTAA